MTDTTKLGPWVRRFLLEHLVDERNLARNTQRSYRDSLALLISFIATKVRKEVDQLIVGDITAERLRLFLQDLEQTRGYSVSTRNQRLAMVHALARFIAEHGPEHIEWCGAIDINTIRAWLGHVSIDTTNIYAETDLEMKAKALATCEVKETKWSRRWKEDKGLMMFLRTL